MEELQEGSSEPSISQNTDNSRHQENISMEGKRVYAHALLLDIQNGNHKLKDTIDYEIE